EPPRRPRGRARPGGGALRPGHGRGDHGAALASRGHVQASAMAYASPGALALLGATVAIVLVVLAGQTHKGTGVAANVPERPGLEQVALSQTAAHDYNPFGTGPENRDLIDNVVDNDPNTTWSTEQYYEHSLRKPGGVGLGLYLDAA